MRKLLIISDGVPHTGYGRVTRAVIERLKSRFEIHLLGLNSFGDPVDMGCPVYPAYGGGDSLGLNRLPLLLERLEPDTVLILQDAYLIGRYLPHLERTGPIGAALSKTRVKTVAWTAVDGELMRGPSWRSLSSLSVLIATTEFGTNQLERVGAKPVASLGYGVDQKVFYPGNRDEARLSLGLPLEGFIVGSVQANHSRKRLDLLCEAFARFWNPGIDAYLLYHGPRNSPQGYDLLALANYYGFGSRLLLTHLEHDALPEYTDAGMRTVYNALDLQITTSSGEGWGLPVLEGMAVGVPQIVPDFAALGEWTQDAASKVPTSALEVRPGLPTLGRVSSAADLCSALNAGYRDAALRQDYSAQGLELIKTPRFDWDSVVNSLEKHL